MLIEDFIHYLQYERGYSPCTLEAYSKDLSQFAEYVKAYREGRFDPAEIDADLVRNWIVFLMDEKHSPRTVGRKLSSLKSFFKFLRKMGRISVDPTRLVQAPKCAKSLPGFVKDRDMESLLDGKNFGEDFESMRDRLILELLYDTGMRRSELVGIRETDVDYEAMMIRVTGKRNKQRLIPFAESLKNLMLAFEKVRDQQEMGHSEWLLPGKGGRPLSTAVVYKVVRKYLSSIPLLAKRSPHVLRHSFATSMLNNGAELTAVKDLLGHSSLASTSVYTHTTFEELKKMYHAHPRAKKEGGFYGN
ncbi:MAG: tyrosine-type recombinase/integrase [bacterium]|nr:tyrosine-type recombinase/integrase [bacterium]